MRISIISLTLIYIILSSTLVSAAENKSCKQISDTIHNFGNVNDEDSGNTVRELHECGLAAVPLLINELRVIDPEKTDNVTWWHMVWCERALRSITGQYFMFKSKEKLGRLSEFRDQDSELGYVMEWMSRAQVYIAPRDVQEKVIHSWKVWQEENKAGFSVAPFKPYGNWYW